uniref:Uncharacterized protein n=1 Tax=Rhipicephalus pulchellus TaxID=72859 RepID=L7LWC3_RHIPC
MHPRCPSGDHVASSSLTLSPLAVAESHSSNRCAQFASCQRDDPYCNRIIGYLNGTPSPPNARLRRQLRQFKLENNVLHRYA